VSKWTCLYVYLSNYCIYEEWPFRQCPVIQFLLNQVNISFIDQKLIITSRLNNTKNEIIRLENKSSSWTHAKWLLSIRYTGDNYLREK